MKKSNMEDSDGSEVEFTVVGQSFQLVETLSDIQNEQEREASIREYINTIEKEDLPVCPDFHPGLEWFNVSTPLSLEEHLRGKLVVLDFFTYCCINCMHILPDLHRLEKNNSIEDGLVVVGVHSAKFENEKVSSNILSAVLRYDITHPTVNDSEARLWHELEIQCWPTLVLISPQGKVLLHLVGEGHIQTLQDFVKVALAHYQDRGEISIKNDLPIKLSKESLPPSALSFPGKVSVDETGKKLAIADTGHHRILVTDLNGVAQVVVGCGVAGFKNGNLQESSFNAPQGVAWKGNGLFIADTENHAIRHVDFDKGEVITLAGTGKQGFDRDGGQQGPQQAISSPWDVLLTSSIGSQDKDVLVIAMAGTHQIWLYFLEDGKWLKGKSYTKGTCVRFAGNGAEENRNNSYPHAAAFAQPSGLALLDTPTSRVLYIADSESSSVRQVSLTDGAVKALVGATRDPRNLFAFGDKDGKGIDAKLQHPLGVAMENKEGGRLLVADSYNHKIKAVDVSKRECHTLLGSGRPGHRLGSDPSEVEFNEPGGLCVHPVSGHVYIADTNNHSLKVYDPTQGTVSELTILIPDVDEVDSPTDEVDFTPTKAVLKRLVPRSAEVVPNPTVYVAPGETARLQLDIILSEGLHPTEGAPLKWQISVQDKALTDQILPGLTEPRGSTEDYSHQPSFVLHPPTDPCSDDDPVFVDVECVSYYCDDDGACRMKALVFEVPLVSSAKSQDNRLTENTTHMLHYVISVP